MELIRASVLGFCFGVRRAVELAQKALEENKGNTVYSLGPLIHNESVLSEFAAKGLITVDEEDISSIKNSSVVIIRAHGVSPNVISELKKKQCKIIDATCPRVQASQKMVQKYDKPDDFIILTGDRQHGEVRSIAGYAKTKIAEIQDYNEALSFKIENNKPSSSQEKNIILLSQTTFSPLEFEKIKSLLCNRFSKIKVMNTVCPATNERQEALLELCRKVEGVLVIGGKNSANTKRLYLTAKENCQYAAHIQSASDIPLEFFSLEKVGITAGASTPDKIILEVEKALKS